MIAMKMPFVTISLEAIRAFAGTDLKVMGRKNVIRSYTANFLEHAMLMLIAKKVI